MNKKKFEKSISKKYPRWINYLYAYIFGYYWLPCPLCGKNYGGHESFGGGIYLGNGEGKMVCSKCMIEKEKEINEINKRNLNKEDNERNNK